MCLSLLTGLAGLYMYAYYAGCDPMTAKRIAKADQLLVLMVVDTMSQYPGEAHLRLSWGLIELIYSNI